MRLEKRLLADAPLQMTDPRAGPSDPHTLPFEKKQRLCENLAKQMEPPSPMQEARVRGQLEDAFKSVKKLRKTVKAAKPTVSKTKGKTHQRREVHGHDLLAVDEEEVPEDDVYQMEGPMNEIFMQERLWSEPSNQARLSQLKEAIEVHSEEQEGDYAMARSSPARNVLNATGTSWMNCGRRHFTRA